MGAELWSLFKGLQMAWDHGIRFLRVEVDNLSITQILADRNYHSNANSSLIWGIKVLLSRDWLISVHHVYREANFAADFFAGMALTLPLGFHLFHQPPPGMTHWLFSDGLGTAFPCFCLT